jgi:hypothetical protein
MIHSTQFCVYSFGRNAILMILSLNTWAPPLLGRLLTLVLTTYCPYRDRCRLDGLVEAIVAFVLLTHDSEV